MTAAQALRFGGQSYENLSVFLDADGDAIYVSMNVRPRPCFTWNLLRDFLDFQQRFIETTRLDASHPRCVVYASEGTGIYSLGGDLHLFKLASETKDKAMLTRYVLDCISALHNLLTTPEAVTIGLLEGDALGAGLETALASDVIIAERGVRAGFPEVLFNLIPGVGGYYLAARRIGPKAAERLIRDGAVHTAEELYDMGLVDILVDKGQGRQAVRDMLSEQRKTWNTFQSLQHVKRHYLPISRDMLVANAEIWVDAAMRLTDRNLRMMERLVLAQERRAGLNTVAAPPVLIPREQQVVAAA